MSTFRGGASRLLRSLPLFHGATGATLFGTSDAVAQGIEQLQQQENKHHGKELELSFSLLHSTWLATAQPEDDTSIETHTMLDRRRLLSAAAIGLLFGGFVYPFAYTRLDLLWPGVSFASVVKKSLLEIATVGILVNSTSMMCRGLLVGRTSHDVSSHVAEEMPGVTVNDARVWLPYNMIAFSVIPLAIRPATTSLMEAAWQTYISFRSHDYIVGAGEDTTGDSSGRDE